MGSPTRCKHPWQRCLLSFRQVLHRKCRKMARCAFSLPGRYCLNFIRIYKKANKFSLQPNWSDVLFRSRSFTDVMCLFVGIKLKDTSRFVCVCDGNYDIVMSYESFVDTTTTTTSTIRKKKRNIFLEMFKQNWWNIYGLPNMCVSRTLPGKCFRLENMTVVLIGLLRIVCLQKQK